MKHQPLYAIAKTILAGLFLVGSLLAAPQVALAKPDLNDGTISDAVEDHLMFDTAVPGYAIEVGTINGVVTLTGTVDNILAKERAAAIAETVKGVRSVVNRIKVSPGVKRSDSEIRTDVIMALAEDPATESFEVDVKVVGGIVELTGTVDSWAERSLCAMAAKGVKGVVDVNNLINVNYKAVRTDGEIAQEIRGRMHWNALLDDGLIDVKVKDGNVTLSGTVGSAAEKREARLDSLVAGVKSVNDSGLAVARWARDEELRKGKYTAKPAGEVEKAIKDALMLDPRVNSYNVEVKMNGGIATLSGSVGDLRAKQAAAQDARNTVGVALVKNRIDVKPVTPLADAQIENKILNAISRDPLLSLYEVDVKVKNGVVTLRGSVDSAYERSLAEQDASKVRGVIYVDNRLDIRRYPKLPYQPYAYDPYPYDYGWYQPPVHYTFKSDARLKKDVEDELWWSPYVDEDDVKVEVENGKVHLTGTVGSWSAFEAATNNAFEAGAEAVNNDLVVIPSS